MALRPREDAHATDFSLYQHAKRPEWGFAIPIDESTDRRVFLFDSGERRVIMNEYAHLMAEVEPEQDVAAKARKYFAKHAAPSPRRPKKPTRRTGKAKSAK